MKTLSKKEGIEFLLKQNKQRKVVPIIGAGFTGGEKSFNGYVPMGNKLKEIMLDAIITNCDDSSLISDIADISFDELSEYFLDERIIPLDKRLKIFKDYFTDVSLPLYKINFLKIWNYIYTLNIDDAIEKNANFKKIVPYSSIRDEQVNIVKAHNYVLKLHGDAEHEILRNCNENIIFSFTQYIASLRSKSNYSLLKSIQSDYKQKNIIFIGCSLKKEPDLLQLYKEVENDIYATSIIYLCCDEPNDKDKRQLKRYGINTILLVDNYDAFYKDIYTEYTKKRSTEELDSFKFKNPSIEIIRSKKEILNIFGFGREIFDIKTSRFCVPSCVTERGVLDEIFVELKSNDFILIKGRRLSGKTTLLHFIIKSMPSYNIIFFPTGYRADENIVKNLLLDSKDTLFIFDSNTITPEIYGLILGYKKKVSINRNKIIIASNINQDHLMSLIPAKEILLKPSFDEIELEEFNNHVDKLAFIRRRSMDTSLDYSCRLLSQHNLPFSRLEYDVNKMSTNQKTLLYMITVFGAIYSHEVSNLDIPLKEADDFIDEYPLLFEKIDVDPQECAGKSIYKYVHNGKLLSTSIISKIKKEDLSISLISIVENLYKNDPQQYKDAILFDTINQIFSRDGTIRLIEFLYEKLESVLYNEPHFWLQRAKSIYHLFKDDKKKLEEARTYARKASMDDNLNWMTKVKASFTLSLIACLLHCLENDINRACSLKIEAIESSHFALTSGSFTPYSVANEILKNPYERSSAFRLLKDISESFLIPDNKYTNYYTYIKAVDIIKKLNEMEHNNRTQSKLPKNKI